MKRNIICILLLASIFMLGSCYEDKGNYTYSEIPKITISNMPSSITAVQKADLIEVNPSFESSIEGNIDDNNNFEYGCVLYKESGRITSSSRYVDIDPEHTRHVSYLPDVPVGDYKLWYTITDKRTGVTSNFSVPVKITSATYEGWMVLCDDASTGNARLDLVSVLSASRKVAVHDILGDKAPAMKGANKIYLAPWPRYAHGDYIWYCTNEGTRYIDAETLKSGNDVIFNDFIIKPENEQVVAMDGIYMSVDFAITNKGNLYARKNGSAGAAFETPVNTFTADTDPQFHVAPFVGVSHDEYRSWYPYALFYDIDNKQFLKWYRYSANGEVCSTIDDPENKKFSFKTGMDLIAMVNTAFSGGVVYSILEDNNKKRYVCGINVASGSFEQSYYQEMNIPGFSAATSFAFHSQYPYMFYNNGSKVECQNLQTGVHSTPLELSGEDITMVKFNLFQRSQDALSDHSDEFLAQQYYLIVGSYKKDATDGNGGVLRFYKFDQNTGALSLVEEYDGFAKIKDVVYRER